MGELVGYARVSTPDQSPALQEDALRQAGCSRIFLDVASGARAARPQLQAALDYLRAGDVLVVWRLDRLGRSLRHLIALVEQLRERDIDLRSLHDAIDTTTPGGRLVFHVFAAVAQFEHELIRERTRGGLAAARARGRRGGRPRVLDDDRLRLARQMAADPSTPMATIARTLGVSRATLYRHLRPPK